MSVLLLPDAPRANKACRICQLIAADESWAKLLYAYRFDKKMKLLDLVDVMKPHIDQWNKSHPDTSPLKYFSDKAASKHFTKHVPTQVQMQYTLQNKMGVARRAAAEKAVSPIVTQQIQAQVNKSVAVFDELQGFFIKLKAMFEQYCEKEKELSPLTIHLEIIRELRNTLGEIGKMRQSKELVRIAVRSVIDTFLTKVVDDAGKVVDNLHEQLVKKYGPNDAALLTGELRKALANTIVDGAREAIRSVTVEFALQDNDRE